MADLKGLSVDIGVPVVITTLDSGQERYLGARPDGSVHFNGSAVTENTRMTLRPAKVRKRTEENRNHVMIVATPVAEGSGPESCVTDERERVLRMKPCRPGDAEQAWRLVPAGDSGLFEMRGAHTAIQFDDAGELVEEDGWTALQTTAVKP